MDEKTRKIFILPFDIKEKDIANRYISPGFIRKSRQQNQVSNSHFTEEIQKKRQRIFNSGLSQLIDKVSDTPDESGYQPETIPPPSQPSYQLSSLFDTSQIELYNLFYNIYIQAQPSESIQSYLKTQVQSCDIDSFILHYYNRIDASYHPLLHHNIDENTIINYTFDISDKTIQKTEERYRTIKFTEYLEKDAFLAKKFSQQLLEKYIGMIIGFLTIGNQQIAISLFYDLNTKRSPEKISNFYHSLQENETFLYPSLNQLINQHNYIDRKKSDLLTRALYFLRSYTRNGHRPCKIYEISIHSSNGSGNLSQYKQDIFQKLQDKLQIKYLDIQYDKFLLLSDKLTTNEIEKSLQEIMPKPLDFSLLSFNYPQDSHNLYRYL